MADDTGAARGGQEVPRALEWEAAAASEEDLAAASRAEVAAGVWSGSRPWSLQEQGRG